MKTHFIDDIEQARLLTDPFKLKLLEQFARQPRTTKQVADGLNEKAPRLYRHVEALVSAGLLELKQEKPKRGTIERYYQTVATRFEVAPQTISKGRSRQDKNIFLIQNLLSETAKDLVRLTEQAVESDAETSDPPTLVKVSMCASNEQIDLLHRKLEEWLEECNDMAARHSKKKSGKDKKMVQATALVAFYKDN